MYWNLQKKESYFLTLSIVLIRMQISIKITIIGLLLLFFACKNNPKPQQLTN